MDLNKHQSDILCAVADAFVANRRLKEYLAKLVRKHDGKDLAKAAVAMMEGQEHRHIIDWAKNNQKQANKPKWHQQLKKRRR